MLVACPTNRNRTLPDPIEVLEFCPGLIEFSTAFTNELEPERWLYLVHPSIREYLFSRRVNIVRSLGERS